MKVIVALLMLALTACGGSHAIAPIGNNGSSNKTSINQAKTQHSKPPSNYKIKKGDTLYSISWRYGMDYKELAKINNIHPPYKIFVGQNLRFKSYKTITKRSIKTQTKPNKQSITTTTKITENTTTKKKLSNQQLTWYWPTIGKVISTYSDSAVGRKGIDIAGKLGQNVIAAASGRVVYSGNGLPRYGNLLIIKHNDVYLSAYAHNESLLFKEGQYVRAGQKIATMGHTGTQINQLHFEIRRNGKPVDPMRFLPKQ